MSGEITRRQNGVDRQVRPSWLHDPQNDLAHHNLEMLESIRNVLIDVKNSQMLQCDVAHAIKRMSDDARQTRLILARIDRRLAKVEKLK